MSYGAKEKPESPEDDDKKLDAHFEARGVADFFEAVVTTTGRIWTIPYHFEPDHGLPAKGLVRRLRFFWDSGDVRMDRLPCLLVITFQNVAALKHAMLRLKVRQLKVLEAADGITDVSIQLMSAEPNICCPFTVEEMQAAKRA